MVEMTRRKAMAGIGSMITVSVAGCSGSDDEGDTATSGDDGNGNGDDGNDNGDDESGDNGENDDGDGSVDILEHDVVEPDVGSYIEIHGEIENNTGEEQSYIEIGAVFHDSEGTRVDDTFTNFTDVPDGETLAFELMTTLEPDEFDEYELETETDAF